VASWQSNVILTGMQSDIVAWDEDENGARVFRPNDPISKIEAFAIMMNLREVQLKDSESTIPHTYTDVAADWQNWYLTTGTTLWVINPADTNNLFNPNLKLSRDELVWIMFDIMDLY
jgi:predicted DNA-binding transcriptional regulator YafY